MRLCDFWECEENDLIKCNQDGIIRTSLQHNDTMEYSLQWEMGTYGSADSSGAWLKPLMCRNTIKALLIHILSAVSAASCEIWAFPDSNQRNDSEGPAAEALPTVTSNRSKPAKSTKTRLVGTSRQWKAQNVGLRLWKPFQHPTGE